MDRVCRGKLPEQKFIWISACKEFEGAADWYGDRAVCEDRKAWRSCCDPGYNGCEVREVRILTYGSVSVQQQWERGSPGGADVLKERLCQGRE